MSKSEQPCEKEANRKQFFAGRTKFYYTIPRMVQQDSIYSRVVSLWIGGLLLALAPFVETPHLFSKVYLLMNGWLKKPEDIFDLLLHGSGLVFAAFYTIFLIWKRRSKNA